MAGKEKAKTNSESKSLRCLCLITMGAMLLHGYQGEGATAISLNAKILGLCFSF